MAPFDTPPPSPPPLKMDEGYLVADDMEEVDVDDGDTEEDNISDTDESDSDDVRVIVNAGSLKDDSCIQFEHSGSVFCCSIDPKSGKTVVTGGQDDRAFIWDISTGNMLLECKGHMDSVTAVGFNFDGKLVATGDMKGIIQVWKISTKSVLWHTNVDELTWMKWHHAANVLLAGTPSGDVYIWKIPSGECKILPGDGCKTDCAIVMPDGKRCAVGYDDGVVKVFDMKTSACIHRIETEESEAGRRPLGSDDEYDDYVASVICMEANVDNNLLITGSLNGVTHLITTQNGKIVGKLLPVDPLPVPESTEESADCSKSGIIETVGFCKDTSLYLAATGNLNGMLCIWDASRQVLRHSVRLNGGISKLLWDKNTHNIYTSCLDGVIRIYDGRSGSLVRELYGHENDILDIAVSVNGDTLVSASDDYTARVFSLVPMAR